MRTKADQIALERWMTTLGKDRVKIIENIQRKGKMESLSNHGEVLTAHGTATLIPHIRSVRKKIEAGKAGKTFALLTPLIELPPQQLAAIGVRTILDSLSASPTLHAVCRDVMDKVWIETMLDRATKDELFKFNRGRSRKAHKMAVIRRMQHTDNWTAREKLASGLFLVELIARETGLITIEIDYSYKPARRVVKATKECMDWINDVKNKQELMTPNYLPMYVKPRPWTSPTDGGYLTRAVQSKFLKSNNKRVGRQTNGSEPFYKAANIQQETAWKINDWALAQVNHAYDNNLEIGCLLPANGWAIPPYPKHLDEDHPDVFRWRLQAKYLHEKNDRTRSTRIAQRKLIWVADKFKDEDEIYFVKQLDFRGRYYDRPPFLNPQGNDVARSLLTFANGTPIKNEDDLNWLRIHGANLYGLKSTFDTRIDWVIEREQLITGAGNDPWINAEFWMRADKPWQFLSFCRAYHLFKREGYGHISNHAINLDCSCSGIQHYSAFLRDDMGKMVNLTDSAQPQDIYATVMTKVNERLRDSTDYRARRWLELQPDRSLAKNVVMCTPYSATRTACYYFAYDWAQKRGKELYTNGGWTTKKGAMTTVHFMAKILHEEATALIQPAVKAMQWFKSIGRKAGQQNTALRWWSPSGLPVIQDYKDIRKTRIQLNYLSDVHLDIRANEELEDLDTKRMANSLSPNVIHSLDSSHMAFATIHAHEVSGVKNIGGIHDCFVTTAGEMSQLRDSVRWTFAEMYKRPVLDNITNTLIYQIDTTKGKELPPTPVIGDFDPSSVKQSTYFIT